MQGIFGKKVCFLQGCRVNTFKLGLDSLLVRFEGETFPVPVLQHKHDGDPEYAERAPLFVTSGSKFRISAYEADMLGVNAAEQNDMMDARFQYFRFPVTLSRYKKEEVSPCTTCCCAWLRQACLPQGSDDQAQADIGGILV